MNMYSLDAKNGRGIEFPAPTGPCLVSFKALAFDTAGGLPFTFHAPLINPHVKEPIIAMSQ